MAAIKFQCPRCKANIQTSNPALAGKKIKCPKCGAAVPVPVPEEKVPPTPPSPPPREEKVTREPGRRGPASDIQEPDDRPERRPERGARRRPRDDERDYDDLPPVKKKKKKKKRKNADAIDFVVALAVLAYIVSLLFAFNGYFAETKEVVVKKKVSELRR